MESLSRLFGGEAKIKLLKIFIFNPAAVFSFQTLVKKTKLSPKAIKSELNTLEKARFIKSRETRNEEKRKVKGYMLDERFVHLQALREFLIKAAPLSDAELTKKLQKAGRLKLVVVAGVFINEAESRADILVVGDRLKRKEVEKVLTWLESEFGRELRYACFDTDDFEYRMGVGDKLLRDIFDYRHHIVFNKTNMIG